MIADASRDSRTDRDIEVHVCNFLDFLLLDRRSDLGALFGGRRCCRRGCGIAGRLAVRGRRLGLGSRILHVLRSGGRSGLMPLTFGWEMNAK